MLSISIYEYLVELGFLALGDTVITKKTVVDTVKGACSKKKSKGKKDENKSSKETTQQTHDKGKHLHVEENSSILYDMSSVPESSMVREGLCVNSTPESLKRLQTGMHRMHKMLFFSPQ